MRKVAVLVTGEPIPRVRAERGSYADMIRAAAGAPDGGEWTTVDLRDGTALPDPAALGGVIVTGSSSSVTERAPWILRGEEYLRALVLARVPTFGICFGHQMLAQALGGQVTRNPRGREIGTVDFDVILSDPLVDGLPAPHHANATHVDTVIRLPESARVLAKTILEPHAAVRFGEAAWGVQFHPEMDAAVIRAYLEERREILAREGLDPDALLARVDEGRAAMLMLRRFAEWVARG